MITILGTGQVGRAILDQLQLSRSESQILLVNKSGKTNFKLNNQAKIVSLDVTKRENLIKLFDESEIVFSCTDVPYQFWDEFYPQLSSAMVAGLQHSNTKLVFADNMYSYGNLKGNLIHEDLPHQAHSKKGKIRAALINNFVENQVNDRVAIVKSSDFIGPRIEKGVFGIDFLKSIYSNKTVNLPGKIRLPHHFTFIEDFAKAMVMIALERDTYNQIWHVPNAPALSQVDWIHLFEQHTGLKIRYRAIPKLAVFLFGFFNPFVKELNELSYQFEYPYLIGADKFIHRFGDISTQPDVIIHKTIQWFNSI